jgi:hypothetical protein
MRPGFILVIALLLPTTPLVGQQVHTLSGKVLDRESFEPIVAANIRIAGTSRGTITNANGEYRLSIESGTHEIIFSSLGYQPDTLRLTTLADTLHIIRLHQSPIEMTVVEVLAEDPALEIIRKAIANKHRWLDSLRSYRFEAYTRQVLRRDTSIASITEAYTTGYMRAGDTLREVVKQKRQTENIPIGENFAAVGRIINFNDDEINLFGVNVNGERSGYMFTGPTAPHALEEYDYKLLSTSVANGIELYNIRMIPKSRLRPLFDGTITIAEGTYAVIGVDVKPNETLNIPFLKDIDLRFRQQFSLYENTFWMPSDIRISGSVTISLVLFSLPRIGIEQTSSIYDYAVNAPIPDSVLQKPRLRVDSSAVAFDSTFWKEHDVLPLTKEETAAYVTLDSTQTLEKQFEPKGPLSSVTGIFPGGLLDNIDVRFNRVEGFFLGVRTINDSLSDNISVRGSVGAGFSDNIVKYNLGATFFTSKEKTVGIGGDVYRILGHAPDGNFYEPFPISLFALTDKNDYRDYFLASGWRAFVSFDPARRVHAIFSYNDEQQYSMPIVTDYSLFFREKVFRQNPQITDGALRSLRFSVRLGSPREAMGIVTSHLFEFSVEHSSPTLMNSEFDFTQYAGRVTWSVKTFSQRLLFSPTLRLSLNAGTSRGVLPPQNMFTLDSRLSGYAPFGVLRGSDVKEFGGDRFVLLSIEHNFRSVPWLALNIPFLYRNGIELIVHGSIAQAWQKNIPAVNIPGATGWYCEAGVGVSRLFDIFRLDFSYRFKEPSRFFVTFSLANLF